MKVTSAQAAKMLRQLNEAHRALRLREDQSKTFLAALGEDVESARPEYDYAGTQQELEAIEGKIRKLKHAISVFNTTTVIPEFGITVDEMLVYLPQLSQRESRLSNMKAALPKTREATHLRSSSSVIDYRYANYDIKQAETDYNKAADELARAQTALDVINNTVEFEIDL
ncbi:MAG: hypothetical protein IJ555_07500 [Ruminococcus sp.]|nr:hypothetical protein [Ruminococcus sp.]